MVINFVISASSDIGFEYVKDRFSKGEKIIGTYRDENSKDKISKFCEHSIYLDLYNKKSIEKFLKYILDKNLYWDKILFCPCQPYPYKSFFDSNFNDWQDSFKLNHVCDT